METVEGIKYGFIPLDHHKNQGSCLGPREGHIPV
jgi:hypothetical protein